MKSLVNIALYLCLFVQSNPILAVEFSLFGDVSLKLSSDKDVPPSFSLGELDLLATQELSDHTKIVTELLFESQVDDLVVDIERLNINTKVTDWLSIAAGRFHSPLGYWNSHFHHGLMLQDTVTRPFFLEFEDDADGVLPIHGVGMLFSGRLKTRFGIPNYQLLISNSTSLDTTTTSGEMGNYTLAVANKLDHNSAKSITFRGGYALFNGRSELGGFIMINNIVESGLHNDSAGNSPLFEHGATLFEQTIFGADFNMDWGKIYMYSEFFLLDTKDRQDFGDVGLSSDPNGYLGWGFYSQLGFRMTEKITTVLRYEKFTYEGSGAFYDLVGAQKDTRWVFSVRYDLHESNGFRLQLTRGNPDDGSANTALDLQWVFLAF